MIRYSLEGLSGGIATKPEVVCKHPGDLTKEELNTLGRLMKELIIDENAMLSNIKPGVFKPEPNYDDKTVKEDLTYDKDLLIYKAILDNEIVGFVIAKPVEDYKNGVAIMSVTVSRSHRGMGVGKAMIKSVLEDLKVRFPGGVVFLSVIANNVAAKKLYADAGFSSLLYETIGRKL